MKQCKECKDVKDEKDFYGSQGECKECTKKRVKLRESILRDKPDWLEKERERHREKYKRLNYREKQIVWNEKRPHTKSYKYKNSNRNNKIPKGFEVHHWNYLDSFLEDFFILPINQHRKSHTFLNKINNVFEGLNGELLDTREKHFNYLVSKGILF
jgi:hypothetical protein